MHNAIVTGGSRGIGYAVAHALVAGGHRVTITGLDRTRLDAAVSRLSAVEGAVDEAVAGAEVDVRNSGDVDRLVADAVRRFGGLDLLVNNAGVGAFAELEHLSDDAWSKVIDTNLTGAFYATRAAIPAMRKGGGGWIINIASLASRNHFPGGAAYCASKAGLLAMTEAVMQEVRFDGIRVSVVMPGSVATEFNGRTVSDDDAWKLAPDDVAEVVMDLLRHPARSLPSRVEIRPAVPKKKG
jgi:NAD(P)-dependent dehydrogenase (short-subunit alcohol dehydrogenase family)